MSIKLQRILSIVLGLLQVGAQGNEYVSPEVKYWCLVFHIALENVLKEVASKYNPDGTRAEVAYVKGEGK